MAIYKPRDHYFQKAKKEGFAARSIYKLETIDERHHILRKGDVVLDLGASPGSWTQYASRLVGERGRVVAIDKKALGIRPPANVAALMLDAFETPPEVLLAAAVQGGLAPHAFDVVVSDMAPATTGDRFVDQQRSADLCLRALELARALLRPGGNFVAKLLEGESGREVGAARGVPGPGDSWGDVGDANDGSGVGRVSDGLPRV